MMTASYTFEDVGITPMGLPQSTRVTEGTLAWWLQQAEKKGKERRDDETVNRMARVLWMRYCRPHQATLDEIGGELGLTRERVRQIENDGLSRLRRGPRAWVVAAKDLDPDTMLARKIYGWSPAISELSSLPV